MTDHLPTDVPADRPPVDTPKVRRCLRCNVEFESEWSGERICKRCKSSKVWSMGSPARPHSAGGRSSGT